MKNRSELLGACGLYCGACYHHRAALAEGQHLLEEAAHQGRALAGFSCQGCRSGVLYVHPGCSRCQIRACTDEKGIEHCGLCHEFPCDRLQVLQNDGRVHHRDILVQLEELAANGADQWLADQAQRWTCQCGARFSWYELVCHRCGTPLRSYGSGPAPPSHGSGK
jgi:hypothetical protein